MYVCVRVFVWACLGVCACVCEQLLTSNFDYIYPVQPQRTSFSNFVSAWRCVLPVDWLLFPNWAHHLKSGAINNLVFDLNCILTQQFNRLGCTHTHTRAGIRDCSNLVINVMCGLGVTNMGMCDKQDSYDDSCFIWMCPTLAKPNPNPPHPHIPMFHF